MSDEEVPGATQDVKGEEANAPINVKVRALDCLVSYTSSQLLTCR